MQAQEAPSMTSLSDAERERIIRRYSDRLKSHGVDLRTLNVGDPEKYRIQHSVHAQIGGLAGRTLVDLGCGLATFYEYLRLQHTDVRYIGYDLIEEFVAINRARFPEAEFVVSDITRDPIRHACDYIVICQVFNNRYENISNIEVVKAVVAKSFSAARLAVSVDMLSKYVNYEEPELFYYAPEEMFAFGKSLTKFVRLRHDYLPHHFTLTLYKDPAGIEAVPSFDR